MQVQRVNRKGEPGYPSGRQLLKRGLLIGAASVGISAATGCGFRTAGIPARPPGTPNVSTNSTPQDQQTNQPPRLGGEMVAEPQPQARTSR